ncbi:MAG: hypothetical protein KDB88_08195, partial [Flavobacteriales bacterium]|nr:hypothetical protein [Flavobacteriales bacterium]
AYDTTPDKMEFITGEEYLPKEADPIAEPVDAKLEHGSRPPKQDRIHGMEEFGKEPREELMQAIELKFMDAPSAIDTGQDERKEPNEG